MRWWLPATYVLLTAMLIVSVDWNYAKNAKNYDKWANASRQVASSRDSKHDDFDCSQLDYWPPAAVKMFYVINGPASILGWVGNAISPCSTPALANLERVSWINAIPFRYKLWAYYVLPLMTIWVQWSALAWLVRQGKSWLLPKAVVMHATMSAMVCVLGVSYSKIQSLHTERWPEDMIFLFALVLLILWLNIFGLSLYALVHTAHSAFLNPRGAA